MDYYSILGVAKNASEQDIRKAYKKMSMQHHPDRGGDEEKFKQINEAYSTLKDPAKRQQYDNPQPQFNFNSSNFRGGNPFEDMFAHAFGQGFKQQRRPRNVDVTIAANITLLDVLKGKEVIATYRLRSGREETVNINIPPGARHGDTIRYEGLGDDSNHRFDRGNLNVRINIERDRVFDRDNDNLWTKSLVNALDLMLGCSIIVNTLDGQSIKINVPAGTKTGKTLRVPEHGLPNLDTGRRGNMFVRVEADIPLVNDQTIINELQALRNKIGN
jgi:curved DNA-binding protein